MTFPTASNGSDRLSVLLGRGITVARKRFLVSRIRHGFHWRLIEAHMTITMFWNLSCRLVCASFLDCCRSKETAVASFGRSLHVDAVGESDGLNMYRLNPSRRQSRTCLINQFSVKPVMQSSIADVKSCSPYVAHHVYNNV